MRYCKAIFLFCFILLVSGCVTLRETRLPATHERSYSFSAYELFPPSDPNWRFGSKDKDTQSLSFINADNYTYIFCWLTPIFKEYSEIRSEKDIIDYFQNKRLKELQLSPDIILSEKSIGRKEKNINGIKYKTLSFEYKIEKDSYKNIIYYATTHKDFMLTLSLFINQKYVHNKELEAQLVSDLEEIIENIRIKEPKKEDVAELRVYYAYDNFIESADKKYLATKRKETKEKYDIAVLEVQKWIGLINDNYRGYDMLGFLYNYNDKLELFGEGFDHNKALKQFNSSISIRKYYKNAHFNLASLYKNTGNIDAAISEYEMLSKISPNDDNVYYELGMLYEKEKRDRKKAREYYEKAIRYWGTGIATLEELKSKLKEWKKP